MKKLYKSDTNRVLSGVIGGIGEYYDVDATLLRLAFVLIAVLSGFFPCLVAYIIATIIVPEKPYNHYHHEKTTEPKAEEKTEPTETK